MHVRGMAWLAAADAMAVMLKHDGELCSTHLGGSDVQLWLESFVLDAGCLQLCVHIVVSWASFAAWWRVVLLQLVSAFGL